MSKKIKTIPSWFNLGKYKKTENFKISDWYEQLYIRFHMIISLLTKTNYQKMEQYISIISSLIKENPIINIHDECIKDHFFTSPDHPLTEVKENNAKNLLGVHLLTIAELYEMETAIPDEEREYAREYYSNVTQCGIGIYIHNDSYPSWFRESVLSFLKHEEYFEENHVINPYLETPCVVIDLNLSDTVLIEHFKSMLPIIRNKTMILHPQGLRRINLNDLSRHSILPYLDLKIWEKVMGTSIPNRVIADAIIPHTEEGEAVIRKTIKKLANQLMSPFSLSKIASQIAVDASYIEIKKFFRKVDLV